MIQKVVKWYYDENGRAFGKANADLDMAVDALLQSENIDRVLMCTGMAILYGWCRLCKIRAAG